VIVYLSAGRIDEAAGLAQETVALTRKLRARGFQAEALRLSGDIASIGGAETALGYYREALTLADRLGMRPVSAHCHLGIGKLARRAGQLDEARANLTAAVALLREMEMAHWLPGAEAELAATAR
jgi:tetratricopeptide (TPR) repeat protein